MLLFCLTVSPSCHFSVQAGIATILLVTPLQRKLMMMAMAFRKDIAQSTDRRVKFMNEMLQGIRVIKVYAWENSFVQRLSELRHVEMGFILRSSWLKAGSSMIMMVTPTLMTLIAFLTLGATDPNFSAQRIFVALVYDHTIFVFNQKTQLEVLHFLFLNQIKLQVL